MSSDLQDIDQRLDLWTGIISSRFKFQGEAVVVRTAVHPALDLLAVAIDSRLLRQGKLAVQIAFPYGSPEMRAADWEHPERHESKVVLELPHKVQLDRRLDETKYQVSIGWQGAASFTETKARHTFTLSPRSPDEDSFEFVVAFRAPKLCLNSRMRQPRLPPASLIGRSFGRVVALF